MFPAIPSTKALAISMDRQVKFYNKSEMRMILSEKLKSDDYKAYLLILSLYRTGARISELIHETGSTTGVMVKDIDFLNAKTIRLHTLKRKKDKPFRYIPMADDILLELYHYVQEGNLKFDDYVFPISRKTAHNWVKRACEEACLFDERSHCHTFRHSFAMNCIHYMPITALQELLGHRDLSKTLIYAKMAGLDLSPYMKSVEW